MQHIGDLVVDGHLEIGGQVTGTTYVDEGGVLIARGQLAGGLIIRKGGIATIYGQVSRNVVNEGTLTLHGQVCGKILGYPPVNALSSEQVVGMDLPVPFQGRSHSSVSTSRIR
jgi:hypothetical protein